MMKQRVSALLAATAVFGVTTAFAANPFSDVTPQDWAYQAVSQLAAEGVVNGYPDGTFKGQHNITRYEMAQMVAKAMARQDRNNAEQQAMINRLAEEFSSELNSLGVRVSTLENKVGNFKFTGDARLRYQGSDKVGVVKQDGKSQFDMRGRLNFEATVNNNTKANIRVTTDNVEFGDGKMDVGAKIDRLNVSHNLGKYANVTAGRYGEVVGQGLIYDDTFDGAKLSVGTEALNASVAHGYFMEGQLAGDKAQSTIMQLNGKLKDTSVSGFYAKNHEGQDDAYGVGVNAKLNRVWVGGEWARSKDTDKSNAWTAGVGYGDYDISKKGTWGVKAQYFSLEEEAPVASSTWNIPVNQDYKTWMATADYAMAKNLGLSAHATFNSQTQDGRNLPEYYRAELNYKF